MGFRDVDVTGYDRAVIRWSHNGDSNTSQDYSFFAVNDRPHGDKYDPLEAIRRGSARRDQQRRAGTYEGSTQTPELSASLIHRMAQFSNRVDSLDISNLSGKHAIGFGAQISTDNKVPISFHVDVIDVYLERSGTTTPTPPPPSSTPPPPPEPDAVDCEGEWVADEACPADCAGRSAIQNFTFRVTREAKHGGKGCEAEDGATKEEECTPKNPCKPPPTRWLLLGSQDGARWKELSRGTAGLAMWRENGFNIPEEEHLILNSILRIDTTHKEPYRYVRIVFSVSDAVPEIQLDRLVLNARASQLQPRDPPAFSGVKPGDAPPAVPVDFGDEAEVDPDLLTTFPDQIDEDKIAGFPMWYWLAGIGFVVVALMIVMRR